MRLRVRPLILPFGSLKSNSCAKEYLTCEGMLTVSASCARCADAQLPTSKAHGLAHVVAMASFWRIYSSSQERAFKLAQTHDRRIVGQRLHASATALTCALHLQARRTARHGKLARTVRRTCDEASASVHFDFPTVACPESCSPEIRSVFAKSAHVLIAGAFQNLASFSATKPVYRHWICGSKARRSA